MLDTLVLDQTVLEQVILGFRESEVYMPEFVVTSIEREANTLKWVFYREYGEKADFTKSMVMFDGKEVVYLRTPRSHAIQLRSGDTLKIIYTVNWEHRGGGDSDKVVCPAPVGDGLRLHIYSTVA